MIDVDALSDTSRSSSDSSRGSPEASSTSNARTYVSHYVIANAADVIDVDAFSEPKGEHLMALSPTSTDPLIYRKMVHQAFHLLRHWRGGHRV